MKLYSVVYETEYVVDSIDFDSVEEMIFFLSPAAKKFNVIAYSNMMKSVVIV